MSDGFLINPYRFAVAGSAPAGEYRTTVSSTADATSYTFSATDIGAAATDRLVVVVLHARNTGTAVTASSVSIGGVGATFLVRGTNSGSNGSTCELWAASVPTGTTADIAVTWSATAVRCICNVYRLVGMQATPYDTASTTSNPGTLSVDVVDNAYVVAGHNTASGSVSYTWAGATENVDVLYESVFQASSASHSATSTEAPRTVTATATATGNPVGASASFRPA